MIQNSAFYGSVVRENLNTGLENLHALFLKSGVNGTFVFLTCREFNQSIRKKKTTVIDFLETFGKIAIRC